MRCTPRLVTILLVTLASLFAMPIAFADDSRELQLDEQPLSDSLKTVADEFGLDIAFFSETTEGLEGIALAGNYTPVQAFDALLGNTDLKFTQLDNGTVVVRAVEEGEAAPGKAQPTPSPILMAQVSANQSTAAPTTSRSDGITGTVRGKITDARSGANLKGALITLANSGKTTRSDELGEFRFLSVPIGTHIVRVSYIGSAEVQASINVVSGDHNPLNVALSDAIEEIVVFGTRSARALSLNQQRTAANNSEVVSADTLGDFPGTTISEALRRVSGVSFQQDPQTGEGTNIIVRGIQPDMNTVRLNGLRVPDSSGVGRAADLSNMLADSVSSITVHKSLLPSHDSNGVGAVVEVETKSPLDRARRYLSVSIEVGQRGSDFSDDFLGSATVSGQFGESDNFGLSASVQYRERSFDNLSYGQGLAFGQYLPLEADGTTSIMRRGQVDPRLAFPFEPGADDVYPTSLRVDYRNTDTTNLTATLSSEWQVADHTNLRFDLQQISADRKQFNRSIQHNFFHSYAELPVAALGGDPRYALTFANFVFSSQNYLQEESEEKSVSASFRGETEKGHWDFSYSAGIANGETDTPINRILAFNGLNPFVDPSVVAPEAVDPIEGRVVSIFGLSNGGGINLPLLTQAGFDALNDPDNYGFSFGAPSDGSMSFNDRSSGEVSGRYTFSSQKLKYLEMGLFYESAEFVNRAPDTDEILFIGLGATAASLGGVFDQNALSRIGASQSIDTMSLASTDAVIQSVTTLLDSTDSILRLSFPRRSIFREQTTKETEKTGYLQAAIEFGKLEIVGGVRISSVDTQVRKVQSPRLVLADGTLDFAFQQANTELVGLRDTVTDVLPRVLLIYRQSDNTIFRGGYFLSIARPTLDDLSRTPDILLNLQPIGGPDSNQPQLSVSQGNPGLEPALSHNFELGVERYYDDIGLIKAGVFYKRIDSFLQNVSSLGFSALGDVDLPDDPRFQNLPTNIFISALRPTNSDTTAEISGFDFSLERRFTKLPGIWSGLGVFANYTYTDSSRDVSRVWNESPIFDVNGVLIGREQLNYVLPSVRFAEQPRQSGTAAATYSLNGVDAALSYTAQARRMIRVGDNGLNSFAEGVDSLDFRIEYRFETESGGRYRAWLEGSDLLDGASDATLSTTVGGFGGARRYETGANYTGGRAVKVGFSATF